MTTHKLKQIIAGIHQSDKKALEQLVDMYYHRLVGFALSFLKNSEMAEEVVMDTFLKIWQNRASIPSIKNIETYAYVMVRNMAHNHRRKKDASVFEMLEEKHLTLMKYEHCPETSMIADELLVQVNRAVDALPPKCKVIFKLIREDGLGRKEAAEILNISVKTIDNQIAIAIDKIATSLKIDLKTKSDRIDLQHLLLVL